MNYFQKKDELLAAHLFTSMERIKAEKSVEWSKKELLELEKKLKEVEEAMESVVENRIYVSMEKNLVKTYGSFASDGVMRYIAAEAAKVVMNVLSDERIFKDA